MTDSVRLTSRFGTLPVRPWVFVAVQLALLITFMVVALVAVALEITPLYVGAVAVLALTAASGWVFTPEVVESG